MKLVKILSIVFMASVFMAGNNKSNIPVYDFDALKPYLEKDNDTTYILNFWASWCKPCVDEMPDFQDIHDKYKDEKVKLLLISLDLPSQIDSRVIPFLKENNITAPVILLDDPKQNVWINAIDSSWSGSIPATLVYGPGGREFLESKLNYEEIEKLIHKYKKS